VERFAPLGIKSLLRDGTLLMIKELFARIILVLFIIGLSSEVENDATGSAAIKQQPSGQPSKSAETL
jgi:hypothetical protein